MSDLVKAIVVIVLLLSGIGVLVYFAKKNEKLKEQIEELESTNQKQVEVTKVYEEKQKVANEIKEVKKDNAGDSISAGNSIVDSFNKLSNKGKK